MATITAFTNISLDGVYQAPGRPDEDRRGGFSHGGWATPYEAMTEAGDLLGDPGELLFGRWTYELFHASWGTKTGNPFSDFFNATKKHVVTRKADYVASWQNTSVITGDTDTALTDIKRASAKNFLVFGSGELLTRLSELGLVDQYLLLIHPLFLGSGKAFCSGLATPRPLKLQEVRPTRRGVLVARYATA